MNRDFRIIIIIKIFKRESQFYFNFFFIGEIRAIFFQ